MMSENRCFVPCPVQNSKRHCDLKRKCPIGWESADQSSSTNIFSFYLNHCKQSLAYTLLGFMCKRKLVLPTSQKFVGSIKLYKTFEGIKYQCKGLLANPQITVCTFSFSNKDSYKLNTHYLVSIQQGL